MGSFMVLVHAFSVNPNQVGVPRAHGLPGSFERDKCPRLKILTRLGQRFKMLQNNPSDSLENQGDCKHDGRNGKQPERAPEPAA